MNHRGIRLAHVAFVGLCLTWMGCGSSDVPDPNSDSTAAKDEGVPTSDSVPAAPSAVSDPAGGQEKPGLAAGENAAPEPAEPAAPATKGDSSATSELLALANSNAGPGSDGADSAGSTTAADPAAGAGGGQPSEPGGMAGAVIGVKGPGGANGYPTGGPPGVPGVSTGPGRGGKEGMNIPQNYGAPGIGGAGAPAGMIGPGGPGAGAGGAMLGGPAGGGGGGAVRGGVYALQYAAVTEFLDAIKSKNKDKLAEAVALRAPQEAASEKNKKLFSAILDQSVGDSDIDEMAKAVEGFQIIGNNEAKSSGRLGIIIGKTGTDGDRYQRTVTVRREAKGWRVVDVSPQGKIDVPNRGRTKGRTR